MLCWTENEKRKTVYYSKPPVDEEREREQKEMDAL